MENNTIILKKMYLNSKFVDVELGSSKYSLLLDGNLGLEKEIILIQVMLLPNLAYDSHRHLLCEVINKEDLYNSIIHNEKM